MFTKLHHLEESRDSGILVVRVAKARATVRPFGGLEIVGLPLHLISDATNRLTPRLNKQAGGCGLLSRYRFDVVRSPLSVEPFNREGREH